MNLEEKTVWLFWSGNDNSGIGEKGKSSFLNSYCTDWKQHRGSFGLFYCS